MTTVSDALDSDIALAHERFALAMQNRLPSMAQESKERYFAVLSALVGKLESPDKTMRDILNEMMVEAATHIMEEMRGAR